MQFTPYYGLYTVNCAELGIIPEICNIHDYFTLFWYIYTCILQLMGGFSFSVSVYSVSLTCSFPKSGARELNRELNRSKDLVSTGGRTAEV